MAYKTWCGIKARCYRKSDAGYKHYGAKGIGMYEDWITDPVAFIEYIGQPPSPDHSLDRIDNTKGYEPGNLRWANDVTQANNKSNNRILVWRGQTYTLAQLARKIASECDIGQQAFESALRTEIKNQTTAFPRK